jgi:hypothetical protein
MTTHDMDRMLSGDLPHDEAQAQAYYALSTKLNDIINEKGTLILSKEETANGDYKALSPEYNNFSFNREDGTCHVSTRDENFWENFYD